MIALKTMWDFLIPTRLKVWIAIVLWASFWLVGKNRFLCRVSFGERVLSRLFLKADGNAATTNGEARDIDEPGCHGGNEHILCSAHRRSGYSRISWRMPNCVLG